MPEAATPRALVVHVPRSSDPLDIAMLDRLAASLHPVETCIATTEDVRVHRLTGLPTVDAGPRNVLRMTTAADAVVVLNPHLGAHAPRGALRLRDLFMLSLAVRAAGKRLALLGATASAYESANQSRAAASIALTSDFTVVSGRMSADRLVALGVPSPVRVAADPAWLGAPAPVSSRSADHDLTVLVDNGRPAVGAQLELAGVVRAIADTLPAGRKSTVQILTWNGGTALDADLHAAAQLQAMLTCEGISVQLEAPAPVLSDLLPTAASGSIVLATHPHAVVSAVAAGLPTIHVRNSATTPELLDGCDVPALVLGHSASAGEIRAVLSRADAAVATAPAYVAEARRQALDAVDLLRLLLTNGHAEVPEHRSSLLRPIGVVR